jgi:hypothetical protein
MWKGGIDKVTLGFLEVLNKGTRIKGFKFDSAPIFILLQLEGILIEYDFAVDLLRLGIHAAILTSDSQGCILLESGSGIANPAHYSKIIKSAKKKATKINSKYVPQYGRRSS